MAFLVALAKFVKLVLAIAITLLFLRAILFPNAFDILILMMLSFVMVMLMIATP
ncbi:hypothetical protein [Effusibacillus dendaii]|uniref:Uncharacterized protein n=1 Tax=Effusibacillus dendaii TaxID=2743772 RepID=A0A7I8D4Q2_9BACL|nr:hypothetical protein [Effusibacillus dendaii]BCJ85055.1 hypothetical protein skT53_00400 [Effusibacillus dendaii]